MKEDSLSGYIGTHSRTLLLEHILAICANEHKEEMLVTEFFLKGEESHYTVECCIVKLTGRHLWVLRVEILPLKASSVGLR